MWDLRILEFIIAIVAALSVFRPFIKQFRGVEGILFLPFLDLLVLSALFAAYGFRPEVIPLFLYTVILFVFNLPRLFDALRRLRTDDYGEASLLRAVLGLLILAGTTVFAMMWAPAPVQASTADHIWSIRDNGRSVELLVSHWESPRLPPPNPVPVSLPPAGQSLPPATATPVFQPAPAPRYPVVVVLPPVLGSTEATDRYCSLLANQGFEVISFSRSGVDIPAVNRDGSKRIYPGIGTILGTAGGALLPDGTRYRLDAEIRMEEARLADLHFLLGKLHSGAASGESEWAFMDDSRITLAGFAEGGAAAIRYAATASDITALVSIEGRLASSLVDQDEPDAGKGFSARIARSLDGILSKLSLNQRRTLGSVPSLSVPSVFIVSDRVRELEGRDGRYAGILRLMRTSKARSVIVSMAGAGAWDYADFNLEFPMYSALCPGAGARRLLQARYVEKAVELTATTARTVNNSAVEAAFSGPFLQAEFNGHWQETGATGILQP